ncbi:hypothetical protein T484DRAFT_1861876 [Baffinella frigidus]|nr:hypothetical protein T484DRAFT_1861876 [Cryptophyta sp. CCMP2293]
MADRFVSRVVQQGQTCYHIMLSYRVSTDSDVVYELYKALNNAVTPGGVRVKVYLDRFSLIDAKDWQQGFSEGLRSSLIFMPVLSSGYLGPLAGVDVADGARNVGKRRLAGDESDLQDNVLLELLLAKALTEGKGARTREDTAMLQDIFPVIVGDRLDDGGISDFFADGNSDGNTGTSE